MGRLYLYINTVNLNYASFAIFTGEGVVLYLNNFIDRQERLNAELSDFLKKSKLAPRNISGVLVVSGPGSFSASRSGIILSNSFNFLYNIPVLGVKDAISVRLEKFIKDNLAKLKHAKRNAVAEVYYRQVTTKI